MTANRFTRITFSRHTCILSIKDFSMGSDEDVADRLAEISEVARKQRIRKLMKNELEPCSGCGTQLFGGDLRCDQMFKDLGKEIGSFRKNPRLSLLTTAAYFLQHPWKLKSKLSALSHLGTIHYLLEVSDRYRKNQAYIEWLRAEVASLDIPPNPTFRGQMTLSSLYEDERPYCDLMKVEAWAQSVWEAYSDFHSIASKARLK